MSNIPIPQIIRSNRLSISIQINRDGEFIVKAPRFAPMFVIQKFINEKSEWIQKALAAINKRKPTVKGYNEGEKFLFLGNEYSLKHSDGIEILLKDSQLHLPKVMLFRAQKELNTWYIQKAREIIAERVEIKAKEMKAHYTGLLFSDTKSKWGTCFPDNSLQFNWRLVMAPLMVLDYVVIHELAHTFEKNHGRSFWSKVKAYTPAFRQHRKWLNNNAGLLSI